MPASDAIPFEGVLNCWNDEHDLPDLLLAVSRSAKTGRLLFSNPDGDKTLYVKKGRIIFAESSSGDDTLGLYLLRTGKISLMDYTSISKRVTPQKRFGTLLVERKILEASDLVPAVMGQVRAIILGLFRRTETWYGFKEEELSRKESITLDLPTAQLILEGVHYVDSWRRISKGVGSAESVYRRVEACESQWSELELTPEVRELLTMMKAPVSLAHICTHATLSDFDACRYLWAFRCLGWIQPLEAGKTASEKSAGAEAQPSKPVPTELVKTQVAVETNQTTPAQASTLPPGRIPEDLVKTQAEAKPSAPPAQSPPPRRTPEHLAHTQMYVQAPSAAKPVPGKPPSTGEMMEAILEGESSAPPVDDSGPAPSSSSPDSTQFFASSSALDPLPAPEPDESPYSEATSFSHEVYDDFVSGQRRDVSGLEARSSSADANVAEPNAKAATGNARASAPGAPIETGPVTEAAPEQAPPSFGDLALSEGAFQSAAVGGATSPSNQSFVPEEPPSVPIIEASAVEVVESEDSALPPVEAVTPPREDPTPEAAPAAGGMEAFAASDPFQGPDAGDGPQFTTEDPLGSHGEPSPPRPTENAESPSSDDMDLDLDGLGHVFGVEKS